MTTKKELKSGYTTGACAAAATLGAALMLKSQQIVDEVSIHLPAGVDASFKLNGQNFSKTSATAFVIKDAGDDPDITNGAEIHSTVTLTDAVQHIEIKSGKGVGTITKPGLSLPVGSPAINRVPLKMITEAIMNSNLHLNNGVTVEISIPDGEKRGEKTLNSRLGIIGGLSILGTTGIVKPLSAKAWRDTIDASIDVAKATKMPNIILSTGRTSEKAAFEYLQKSDNKYINLSESALVMMGDHIQYSLISAIERGFDSPFIACQFAKLLKIACGYENTHATNSELDLKALLHWVQNEQFSNEIITIIKSANTAREVIIESSFDPSLIQLVKRKAFEACRNHTKGVKPIFLLAGYDGGIIV